METGNVINWLYQFLSKIPLPVRCLILKGWNINMKNKSILVLLLIIFSLSLSTPAQAALGNVLLKVGSTGADVVELQTKLNDVGFNVGKVDGIFGSKTKQGVINFQQAHSLVGDGIVGPLTVKSLNEAYLVKQRQNKVDSIYRYCKTISWC